LWTAAQAQIQGLIQNVDSAAWARKHGYGRWWQRGQPPLVEAAEERPARGGVVRQLREQDLASTAEPATHAKATFSRLSQGVKAGNANSRNDHVEGRGDLVAQCIVPMASCMTGPIHPLFYTVHGNIAPWGDTNASLSIAQ